MTTPTHGLFVQLLGRPRLEVGGARGYRFRSRKSWAVLAFLLLAEGAPTRSRLAGLLFDEADDPLAALRWCLAEIRRGLGPEGSLDGDPVRLTLPRGAVVDVDVLEHGHWSEAVALPGLGAELLDGLTVTGAAAYESWLLAQRRRTAAATETILHEAAVGHLARGEVGAALDSAVRAATMSPLDENHQALLIRLYRLTGDDEAATRQYAAWSETAQRELGAAPGAAAQLALRERRAAPGASDPPAIEALVEAGTAAVSAGAVASGVASLENALDLADRAGDDALRVRTRLVLADALIHAVGGLDEEGVVLLADAERIALDRDDSERVARARAMAGYVDFLRGRYERAEVALVHSLAQAPESVSTAAEASTYLGSVASDRADYPRALAVLADAVRLARAAAEPRREAYAVSMIGRIRLLRGELDEAAHDLSTSIGLAEREHWLGFLPWPQALLGQVLLSQGDVARAAETLDQAFARACRLGDPCWEGISARGRALVAEARGDADRAFELLLDARARSGRLSDPYQWLDVHLLDALCTVGRRHDHPLTAGWVELMRDRAARSGMRELTVRALLHGAALGHPGDADAAAVLAEAIDNPVLRDLVTSQVSTTAPGHSSTLTT